MRRHLLQVVLDMVMSLLRGPSLQSSEKRERENNVASWKML